jgi:glycine/D-amino acid oxidase-like deaminating enzyme
LSARKIARATIRCDADSFDGETPCWDLSANGTRRRVPRSGGLKSHFAPREDLVGKPITNVTIVGGGTTGWIVAAYLNQRLHWAPSTGRDVKITVIESPEIGTIGVGEATVPTLKATLRLLNISEAEFMQRTDATFKLGIWFHDWNRDEQNQPRAYLHPFTGGLTLGGLHPGFGFKRYGLPNRKTTDQDFVRAISHAREAVDGMRGPRALSGPPFRGALQYAYHIDAGKFAEFLREVCVARGVSHVRDNVVDVKLDERGYIASLQLKEGGEWPVELVIDCTGFRGLLINQALGEPFESYSDYLLNDRAIPVPIAHDNAQKIESVTTSTALEAGWSWRIPLHSRVGTGYVYSSAFKSDDEALEEYRRFLGSRANGADPRVIKMRVGRTRRSWVNNCVAMGLSSGFVEPLESTAIMSVELQTRWLLYYLPTTDFEAPLRDQFNNVCERLYDEIRDFLCIHFSQSGRDDTPYWRAVRQEAKKSDVLDYQLRLWKNALPGPTDMRRNTVFSHWSVSCLLMGKDFYQNAALNNSEMVTENAWMRYCRELWTRKQQVMGRIADHRRLVDHMRSQAVSGESASQATRRLAADVSTGRDLASVAQPVMAVHG